MNETDAFQKVLDEVRGLREAVTRGQATCRQTVFQRKKRVVCVRV